MPTVLSVEGFKFYFFSDERNEPCHIHVKKGGARGKIWLLPSVDEDYYYGFTEQEKRKIRKFVKENYEFFTEQWNVQRTPMENTSKDKIVNKRTTDPLDRLIFEEGLRMKSIWFDKELDLIIVLLNNRKIIQRPISDFSRLKNATKDQLLNYENDGIGVHWPDVDEDLSLRGFLKYELAHFGEKVA